MLFKCVSGWNYITLLSGDEEGQILALSDLFFTCLRPHRFLPETSEVVFEHNITVNVSDVLVNPEVLPARLDRLFFSYGSLITRYHYWSFPQSSVMEIVPPMMSFRKSEKLNEWFLVVQFTTENGSILNEQWFRDIEL